ncbi:hypothetical protein MGYG_03782 [Nannizzia gypsea CBS 118893]|uniref:Uncharacterized protein n=1 Tax=Arthroderma gypseum (strain ATCC MYA-4604 / CBS 118893) TaxID=535722 RepID=E4UTX2_ARTGP|nr:hypothetical protein MGYG_03782 [Nannizzia gypsea CBS 118893]EFR00778.1 hypothetical protein MGYG_03782 [Nannizzia gypsea CBS 118893]
MQRPACILCVNKTTQDQRQAFLEDAKKDNEDGEARTRPDRKAKERRERETRSSLGAAEILPDPPRPSLLSAWGDQKKHKNKRSITTNKKKPEAKRQSLASLFTLFRKKKKGIIPSDPFNRHLASPQHR